MKASPLFIVITVGYQRSRFINSGGDVLSQVGGSVDVSRRLRKRCPYADRSSLQANKHLPTLFSPPAMSTLPSGSTACPEQKASPDASLADSGGSSSMTSTFPGVRGFQT